jgi:hypothetical protein
VASASDIHATPSSFAGAVSSAQAGDTILLATGNYGTWSGTNKAITIKNEDGASPSMRVAFDTGDGGFTLDGMAGMGGSIMHGASHITIRNGSFSSALVIDGVANAAIVIDHNTFANINAPSGSPNGRIALPYSSSTPSGVTVSNNVMRGGDSDGVHTGTALDVLNNEFVDLCDQGGNHTDNIQFEGAVGGRIAGNYIHLTGSCTTQGITSYDGGTNGVVIEDNVVDIRRSWGIEFYADKNSIIRHNTVVWRAPGCYSGQACGYIDINRKSADPAGSGTEVYDNVALVSIENGSTTARNDNNVSGQQVSYAGGSAPSSWAGFALASGSPGKGAADDGSDVGIRVASSTTPPPTDSTPPDTTITSGPGDPTTSTSASLAFTSSESGSTFECKLDAGPYAACTSPKSYSGLAAGQHTFSVRATDAAGNTDASPATRTWTIGTASDTTPPDTTISAGPGGPTNDTTPTFAFTSSEAGSTFACRVDGGAYAACASPWTTAALADGSHTVSVRATDAAGNTDATPATRGFTVDTVAPRTTITSAPSGNADSTDASVTFAVNEAGSTSECRLDGGAWSPCTSPYQVSGLAAGSHSVGVRSTDPAGNVESPGASASWTVGSGSASGEPPPANAPPTVQLTAPAVGSVVSGRFRMVASADDDHGIDHVDLWVGGWRVARDDDEPYATRLDAGRLRSGIHTLSARAFDSAGQSASAALTVFVGSSEGSSGWAQLSSIASDGVTRLTGQSIAGSDVRVSLTWCSSGRGYVADSFTLHADKDGHLDATYAGGNRCVLRLDPTTG